MTNEVKSANCWMWYFQQLKLVNFIYCHLLSPCVLMLSLYNLEHGHQVGICFPLRIKKIVKFILWLLLASLFPLSLEICQGLSMLSRESNKFANFGQNQFLLALHQLYYKILISGFCYWCRLIWCLALQK